MTFKNKKFLIFMSMIMIIIILVSSELFLKRNFLSITNAIAMDEKWRFHLLINLGEDINQVNCIGEDLNFTMCYTPLSTAVLYEKPYYVGELLQMGAKTDRPDDFPPLESAFHVNNEEIVDLLLNAGAEMNNSSRDVLSVISSDNVYFLQLFLDRHDIPLEEIYCRTSDQYNILKYLLESGVDPDYVCHKDVNTSCKCRLMNSTKLAGISFYDGVVGNNSAELTQLLIDHNANIDFQDDCNNTPLHYAAKGGAPYVVKTLLHNGARTDLKNRDGLTAYELAKMKKQKWIVKIFDEFNANKR